MATAIGMTGVKAAPVTTTEKLDALTQERFGKDFWEMSPYEGVDGETYRKLLDFWDEIEPYQDQLETQYGVRVSETNAIEGLGEQKGLPREFILTAIVLHPGTASEKRARDWEYISFLLENEKLIQPRYGWLYTRGEMPGLLYQQRQVGVGQ